MGTIFKKTRLEPEAFSAYLHRLPERVEVSWKKEGKLIVGRIIFDDFSFATQAKDTNEFITMVNEGVLLAYDTPSEYIEALKENIAYTPPPDELEALVNDKKGELRIERKRNLGELVGA